MIKPTLTLVNLSKIWPLSYLQAKSAVEAGIAREGSNLCGMAAFITWDERNPESDMDANNANMEQVKVVIQNWIFFCLTFPPIENYQKKNNIKFLLIFVFSI